MKCTQNVELNLDIRGALQKEYVVILLVFCRFKLNLQSR